MSVHRMKKKKNPLKQNCIEDQLGNGLRCNLSKCDVVLQEWCRCMWHGDGEMVPVKWERMDRNGVVFCV